MTKKLFYKNTYIKDFTSSITKIIEKNKEFHIQLDQTAFFPEGGGQPCDQGYIDDVYVKSVYEDNNRIFHVLDKLPNKLENVNASIDWDRRFDHMQQHLGQHILSAAFEKLHDARTIGFHLGNDYTTIDIDINLSDEDINNVEYLANQIVFNDLTVTAIYPSSQEIAKLPLRKIPSVKDNIRIVRINDFDYSPCCGTHPNRTGEVGLIKIRKWENYKEGIRIDFVCGNRALSDYFVKTNIVNKGSSILSVKDTDVGNGIEKMYEELINFKKENKYLKEKLIEYEANDLINSCEFIEEIPIIISTFKGRDFAEIRQLSSIIVNNKCSIVILGNTTEENAQIILSRSKDLNEINMKDIFKEIITLLDGKGGGNKFIAQGGGKNKDNLDKSIKYAHKLIRKSLK